MDEVFSFYYVDNEWNGTKYNFLVYFLLDNCNSIKFFPKKIVIT